MLYWGLPSATWIAILLDLMDIDFCSHLPLHHRNIIDYGHPFETLPSFGFHETALSSLSCPFSSDYLCSVRRLMFLLLHL